MKDVNTLVLEKLNASPMRPHVLPEFDGKMALLAELEAVPLASLEELADAMARIGHSDASIKADVLIQHVKAQIETTAAKKVAEKARKGANKLSNRSRYLPAPLLLVEHKDLGLAVRFPQVPELRAQGVGGLFAHYELKDNSIGFVPLQVQRVETEVPNAWELAIQASLPNGWTGVAGKLMVKNDHPLSQFLTTVFPNAVDYAAYVPSLLSSPVIGNGWFGKVTVVQRKLVNGEGKDLETDGSGIYHPQDPQVLEFVTKYGPVPMQVRFLSPDGWFGKGVLFPSEQALDDGKPAIVFEWLQFKGGRKDEAKKARKANVESRIEGYLGAIQKWDSRSTLSGGFELLENLKVTDQSKAFVTKKAKAAMKTFLNGGIEAIVRSAAKDSVAVQAVVKFADAIRGSGESIELGQIDLIRETVTDRIGKRLYELASGGVVDGERFVARLDATVPRGMVVLPGYPAGTKVVSWRFPIVLAQGLRTLTVMDVKEAPGHLMVDGAPAAYTAVMNPYDLTLGMQGDDDGDIVGISADPEMVEMFQHKVYDPMLSIEPAGEAVFAAPFSDIGRHYMWWKAPGAVGAATLCRSRFLAMDMVREANAMAVSIQENVDSAKRITNFSDYKKLADRSAWEHRDGAWRVKSGNTLDDYEWDVREAGKWTSWAIDARHGQGMSKLALNWREKTKRINPKNWVPTSTPRTVLVQFPNAEYPVPVQLQNKGGNLVHICYDACWEAFQPHRQKLELDAGGVDVTGLLRRAVIAKGGACSIPALTQNELWEAKKASGLTEFNSRMKTMRASTEIVEATLETFKNDLHESLLAWSKTAGLDMMVALWEGILLENPKAITTAINAVAFAGSPVLSFLGVELDDDVCRFISAEKAQESARKAILVAQRENKDPTAIMAGWIFGSDSHGKAVRTPEGSIELHECEDCRNRLEFALLRELRAAKKLETDSLLKSLVSEFHGNAKRHGLRANSKEEAPMLASLDDWATYKPKLNRKAGLVPDTKFFDYSV